IRVRDMLEAANSTATIGSLVVTPSNDSMAVAAQLSISGLNPSRPLHFEEELVMPMAKGSKVSRAGVVSIVGSPVLALRSLSNVAQKAVVGCLDEHGALTEGVVNVEPG